MKYLHWDKKKVKLYHQQPVMLYMNVYMDLLYYNTGITLYVNSIISTNKNDILPYSKDMFANSAV